MKYSGVLLHITSLASNELIGTLGKESYKMADLIKDLGLDYWQILPLGPTGYGNSPYSARSSFAGNELLISLEELVQEGYLDKMPSFDNTNSSKVDFYTLINTKMPILKEVAATFLKLNKEANEFEQFIKENEYWLTDYAVFMTLYDKYNDARWPLWQEEYSEETINKFNDASIVYKVLQYLFYKQYNKFKTYVNNLGIRLIGDIPIFAGADSADVWSNIKIFKYNEDYSLNKVSGVPPDKFSATGQLWGTPVYDWEYNKETDFVWWINRLKHQLKFVDVLRIDHFRGFDEYYEIAADEETALNGKWEKAYGRELFNKLQETTSIDIIAEDLGYITPGVIELRDKFNFPGMKILQDGFELNEDGSLIMSNNFLPHNYGENFVAYPGTHDNPPILTWYKNLDEEVRKQVDLYYYPSADINYSIIKSLLLSDAKYVIIPMQDILKLSKGATMNVPNTCNEHNWSFRLTDKVMKRKYLNEFKELVSLRKDLNN